MFDIAAKQAHGAQKMARNNVNHSAQLHYKIVLLGEGCTGKTSLVLRYVEDKFNDKHFSTIQVPLIGSSDHCQSNWAQVVWLKILSQG